MKRHFVSLLLSFALFFLTQAGNGLAGNAGAPAKKLTPEDLISEHIKSIGASSLLSSLASRAFVGSTSVDFITGINGKIVDGASMFVSQGKKLGIKLQFNSVQYPGEYFAYNEEAVSVGYFRPGLKSPLADFLFRFNGLMKKGFIGGTLSLAWPLLDTRDYIADLKYHKSKVDGRELHELEWPINLLGNIKIRMYFDPDTYHHVRTEYTIYIEEDVSAQIGTNYVGGMAGAAAGYSPYSTIMGDIPRSIYKLVEKFDDYKEVDGMTLPHKYTLDYSLEGQGHSFIGQWVLYAKGWVVNQEYDERIFEAQK